MPPRTPGAAGLSAIPRTSRGALRSRRGRAWRRLRISPAETRAAATCPVVCRSPTARSILARASLLAQGALSGNSIGRLYGVNVIDEWTADVTQEAATRPGERVAEIYWNASTWNPYRVVLAKTQLRRMVDDE